jgi:hypothetical protein
LAPKARRIEVAMMQVQVAVVQVLLLLSLQRKQ